MEYIIVGDTEKYTGCLIYTCGGSKERAEKALERILNNPTEYDLHCIKGHKNLRIEEIPERECWWNDPLLAN